MLLVSAFVFVTQPNESFTMPTLKGSKSSLFMGSTFFGFDHHEREEKGSKDRSKVAVEQNKKLPIINPLVRLPTWPCKFTHDIFSLIYTFLA